MVGVAQRLEHLAVAQGVAGSNPVAHPFFPASGGEKRPRGIDFHRLTEEISGGYRNTRTHSGRAAVGA